MNEANLPASVGKGNDGKRRKLLIICGPTAVGKTSLSVDLARKLDGEIISADSMQIYRGLDIGSAKVTEEEMGGIVHHMIDIVPPFEKFSVSDYSSMALPIIESCYERGKTPIIVGGTGLYINSLIYEMDYGRSEPDPEYRKYLHELYTEFGSDMLYELLLEKSGGQVNGIHRNNVKRVMRALEILNESKGGSRLSSFVEPQMRPQFDIRLAGLTLERSILYERINCRVDRMIEEGLVEEVRNLQESGLDVNCQSMQGIGYKEMISFFNGEYSLETAVEKIKQGSRNYAKRQLTWFNRYEFIRWFDVLACSDLRKAVLDFYQE